uniref:Uncharacterized protein n=1 Tax=Lygus hesperus TaxID=30085 RepID=A0A0A9YAT6_LYGHE
MTRTSISSSEVCMTTSAESMSTVSYKLIVSFLKMCLRSHGHHRKFMNVAGTPPQLTIKTSALLAAVKKRSSSHSSGSSSMTMGSMVTVIIALMVVIRVVVVVMMTTMRKK